ncbi:phage major capsid protein [Pseudaminobacter arsenicus]|uniref:Phage major capsid protein n=2 Tax=Borborobacter arsenicus TaxID=1851146 RepID=A0A432V7H7_9HYPH|nr:phage major capsid protein [Pseudaminobacter arsenicus]
MGAMIPLNSRARGLVAIRNDGGNAAAILNELKQTFETFKAENDKVIADLKKGQEDVVQTEKVERINAELTQLQKAIDETNVALAALKVGGAGGDRDPDKAEHAQAFDRFFRKGVDAGLADLEVKAKLTTQSDPDGGYLVPEETEAGIDRVLGTVSTIRSLSRVINISTDTYKKLVNMGGATSGWVGEEDARAQTSTPTLREIAINTGEIYAMPATTQKALDDSRIDVAAWLADEVSIEFAEKEGAAFASGDGVNKPRGVLSYDMVANADYAWGKIGFVVSGKADGFVAPTASANPADALIDLYYALKSGYRNGAAWLMSDAVMATVRKFKDAQGAYIWNPPSGTAEVGTILGKPVHTDDNMPAVGAGNFPVAFGNFQRAYLIVDRVGIRVLRDPYTSKPNVLFYTTKRVGGGMVNFEAMKMLKIAAS